MIENLQTVCFTVKTKQVDMRTSEKIAHPLDSNDDQEPQAVCYGIDQQGGKSNCGYLENVMPTICSDSHGTPHAVCYAVDVRHLRIDGTVSGTLQAKNTGGHSLNYINPVIYEQDE